MHTLRKLLSYFVKTPKSQVPGYRMQALAMKNNQIRLFKIISPTSALCCKHYTKTRVGRPWPCPCSTNSLPVLLLPVLCFVNLLSSLPNSSRRPRRPPPPTSRSAPDPPTSLSLPHSSVRAARVPPQPSTPTYTDTASDWGRGGDGG